MLGVIAIEVRTDAHVVDAHKADDVIDVGYGIQQGGVLLPIQEVGVETHLHHAPSGGEGLDLLVGEIARMIAQGSGRGVGGDDGLRALG